MPNILVVSNGELATGSALYLVVDDTRTCTGYVVVNNSGFPIQVIVESVSKGFSIRQDFPTGTTTGTLARKYWFSLDDETNDYTYSITTPVRALRKR